MRVSILIMAFLPPFRALTSASSARVAASLHWASKLLVLLQVHGELLLATELIGETGSVHHGASSLVLREPSLVGHLVQVSVELSKLTLKLPLGGSDGLVDVGEVSQSLVGVSELLLSSAALAVSSLKKSTSLLKTVGNSSGPAVGGDLGVGSGGLGGGLLVDLDLGVTHLEGVLLMVVWVSALPAMACSRTRPRSAASPSSFFFILRASALLLVSVSRATCMESRALDRAFLTRMNSSSFSARRRSISCLTALSSSWHLSTLFSSCSRVASASSRADWSSIFSASRRFLILSISWMERPPSLIWSMMSLISLERVLFSLRTSSSWSMVSS